MATKVSQLLGKSGGSAFPGTQVKFRNGKNGTTIKSVKSPKFPQGSKLNLK